MNWLLGKYAEAMNWLSIISPSLEAGGRSDGFGIPCVRGSAAQGSGLQKADLEEPAVDGRREGVRHERHVAAVGRAFRGVTQSGETGGVRSL